MTVVQEQSIFLITGIEIHEVLHFYLQKIKKGKLKINPGLSGGYMGIFNFW